MKKLLNLLLCTVIFGLVSSCTDDINPLSPDLPNGSLEDGLNIILRFPEMESAMTRALGEAPDMSILDLFLFVFDGSNLSQTIHIYPSETKWADEVNPGDSHVTTNRHLWFHTALPQTDNNAVIHIVALKDDDKKFAAQVERLGYAPEDILIPALSVSGTQDAYWQRVELGCPVKADVKVEGQVTEEGTYKEIMEKLKNPIPLIRNFAKIEVAVNPEIASKFKIIGWTVVNELDGGSVAPSTSKNVAGTTDIDFPIFADWSTNPATVKSYEQLVENGYYEGNSLSGAHLRNTLDDVGGTNSAAGDGWGKDARYIYERKYSTVNPLYILIYGEYGLTANKSRGYYKLLLGWRDEITGLFYDYNVLRNIGYTVYIRDVSFAGYESPQEAASSPASNNISGDVVTKDMFSITDGIDMLYVNRINFIITKPDQIIDFRFRYIQNIKQGGSHTQKDEIIEYAWPGLGLPGGNGGNRSNSAISSWTDPERNYTDEINKSIKWSRIVMTPQTPTNEMKQESFYVFSPPARTDDGTLGLSRKINIIVRNPWDLVRVAVYPGQWNDDTKFPDYEPDTDSEGNPYVGPFRGSKLTLFMELPSGLPEAMFPLSFTIESNRQNIENDGVGNAVVGSGTSFWDNVNESRIQYTKTVTWSDYAPNDGKSTASSRIVRMRLQTTTNLTSLDVSQIVSTIRIYNEYFNMTETSFVRDLTSDIDYQNEWDLSTTGWDRVISDLSSGATGANRSYTAEGLTFNSGTRNNSDTYGQLKSGNNSEGRFISIYRYANAYTNSMTFNVTHPAHSGISTRKGILRIYASNPDNSEDSAGVDLSVSVTNGENLTDMTGGNYTIMSKKEWQFDVSANSTTVAFTVKPSADRTTVNIYKVEYILLPVITD